MQLGVESTNINGGNFNPHKTSLVADFYLASDSAGVVAHPSEHSNPSGRQNYEIVKLPAPPTPATNSISAATLWECEKEHYGLTTATVLPGVGGIPIKKMRLGYPVVMGSSKYTNLVSHFGLKFFPMTTLPRGLPSQTWQRVLFEQSVSLESLAAHCH